MKSFALLWKASGNFAQQEVLRYAGIEHGLSCWFIGQLLNNLPSDINTDYRHIAKPWPLAAICLINFRNFYLMSGNSRQVFVRSANKAFFLAVSGVAILTLALFVAV